MYVFVHGHKHIYRVKYESIKRVLRKNMYVCMYVCMYFIIVKSFKQLLHIKDSFKQIQNMVKWKQYITLLYTVSLKKFYIFE